VGKIRLVQSPWVNTMSTRRRDLQPKGRDMKKTLLLATAVLAVVGSEREVHGQSTDQNFPPNFDEDIRSPSFAPQLLLGVSW
jgi:hypothetical protein